MIRQTSGFRARSTALVLLLLVCAGGCRVAQQPNLDPFERGIVKVGMSVDLYQSVTARVVRLDYKGQIPHDWAESYYQFDDRLNPLIRAFFQSAGQYRQAKKLGLDTTFAAAELEDRRREISGILEELAMAMGKWSGDDTQQVELKALAAAITSAIQYATLVK